MYNWHSASANKRKTFNKSTTLRNNTVICIQLMTNKEAENYEIKQDFCQTRNCKKTHVKQVNSRKPITKLAAAVKKKTVLFYAVLT